MSTTTLEKTMPHTAAFLKDTLKGLKASPKYLQSKYFYDERGDVLFQQIMNMDEYYLTDAEMEILSEQSAAIANTICADKGPFDLIELGAGDATKSVHLLKELMRCKFEFTYLPVDISDHVISDLQATLPGQLPGLDMVGLNGDYLDMLAKGTKHSDRRKVVLFMGANIGNMDISEAKDFCCAVRQHLSKGDMFIVGFDLKKDPHQILSAYDDKDGITSQFNLNLLERINRELSGDFDVSKFEHYACYDPESGACKSYLISLEDQQVHLDGKHLIEFQKNEHIYMEISQKYALEDIEIMGMECGYTSVKHFYDRNKYLVDAVWEVK